MKETLYERAERRYEIAHKIIAVIVNSGFLGELDAHSIVNHMFNARTLGEMDQLEALFTEETFLKMKRVLPQVTDEAFAYLKSNSLVRVLEYFNRPEFWQTHHVAELNAITSGHNLASKHLVYFQASEDPQISAWLGRNGHNTLDFVNGLWGPENMDKIFQSPERDRLLQLCKPSELAWMTRHFYTEFILEHFEILRDVVKTKHLDLNWSEKILNLAEVLYRFGLQGVEDQRLNQELLAAYKQNLNQRLNSPDINQQQLQEELAWVRRGLGSSYGAKMRFVTTLRAGAAEILPDMRRQLVAAGQGKSLEEYLFHYQDRLERRQLDWREDIRHPTRELRASLGYEIEFEGTTGVEPSLYTLIQYLGFAQGSGGFGARETSPGPFWDYRTAQETFMLWVRSGLIDIYPRFGQSVHFNIGLKHGLGTSLLIRTLQMTGLALMPEFNREADHSHRQANEEWHTLRNFYNRQGNGELYVESKEFSLTTPRAFNHFLRLGGLLGTALKSFQQVMAQNGYPAETDEHQSLIDSFDLGKERQYRHFIASSPVSENVKTLATIWLGYAAYVQAGLRSVKLGSFVQAAVPTNTSVKMVKQIRTVYPTSWSRGEVKASLVESMPFTFKSRRFANPVHFAQFVANRAATQVEKVLRTTEVEFEGRLRRLLVVERSPLALNQFLSDFPSSVPFGLSPRENWDALMDLAKELKVIG